MQNSYKTPTVNNNIDWVFYRLKNLKKPSNLEIKYLWDAV